MTADPLRTTAAAAATVVVALVIVFFAAGIPVSAYLSTAAAVGVASEAAAASRSWEECAGLTFLSPCVSPLRLLLLPPLSLSPPRLPASLASPSLHELLCNFDSLDAITFIAASPADVS